MSAFVALYADRARRFEQQARDLGASSRMLSNLRGVAFVAVLVGGFGGLFGSPSPGWGISFGLGAVSFLVLVVRHARVLSEEDHASRLLRVNLDAISRLSFDFGKLGDDGLRFRGEAHPYADDLDLFGPGSLFQRLGVARTRFGQEALARFLREPAPVDTILLRQSAVRALAGRLEERQELEALALSVVDRPPGLDAGSRARRRGPSDPPDPEPLLAWAESEPALSKNRLLPYVAWGMPAATVALLALGTWAGLPPALWAAALAVQIAIVGATRRSTDRVFGAVSATEGAFLRYGPMFELVERLEGDSRLLAELRGGLLEGALRPSVAMRRFERAVSWFELRHNPLLHIPINALLLWDVHCVLGLENWQRTAGKNARAWFRVLGEVEALSSFAALSHDEPSFTFPEVSGGPARFQADGLGHPLLPAASRVPNDVALDEPGRALLVTGSNMSGKSTLMRSMGVAAVLAQAGAPVCAARVSMSPLAVRTCIKISDSLARGVSHFYAEVARLKLVLDSTSGPLPVLFLLDEVLHGTNSEERQIGARWLLAELLERRAIGAVSTHDAALCTLPPDLMGRVAQCHFRETVTGGKMSFDYRLRPGPVRGGNALRLMRAIGLDVPLDEGAEAHPAGDAGRS